MEMSKIMTGDNAVATLQTMDGCGVMAQIGVGCTPERMAEFVRVSSHTNHFISRLVGLVEGVEEWETVQGVWRLHNGEKDMGAHVLTYRDHPLSHVDLENQLVDGKKLEWVIELAAYQENAASVHALSTWDVPKFPVNGGHLKKAGMKPGKHMGAAINTAKEAWKVSRFTMGFDDVLALTLASGPAVE
jgi:hypothetical protein